MSCAMVSLSKAVHMNLCCSHHSLCVRLLLGVWLANHLVV